MPVSVDARPNSWNPPATAAASQASRICRPIPRRSYPGFTKNALDLRRLTRRVQLLISTRPVNPSPPNKVFRRLHPPHPTMTPAALATKYVPSLMS